MDIDELMLGSIVFAANRDGTYSIPYKPMDVFNALKVVVPQITGFKVNNINDLGLSLDVNTKMTWKSFGETIQISVLPSQIRDSILSIKSKSHMGLCDWGKNKDNLNDILTGLQKELTDSKYEAVQAKVKEQEADPTDRLIKLKTLLDNNIISKEEFESKKDELLKLL